MEELVEHFEQGERDSWPWNILRNIDPEYIGYGFSEYASYVSWMLQTHPDEVVSSYYQSPFPIPSRIPVHKLTSFPLQQVKSRRTWSRYPPGASLGVAFLKLISPNHLCCPTNSFLRLVKPLGYEFMGFEIGHSNLCGYHKKEYDLSYGLMKAKG